MHQLFNFCRHFIILIRQATMKKIIVSTHIYILVILVLAFHFLQSPRQKLVIYVLLLKNKTGFLKIPETFHCMCKHVFAKFSYWVFWQKKRLLPEAKLHCFFGRRALYQSFLVIEMSVPFRIFSLGKIPKIFSIWYSQ